MPTQTVDLHVAAPLFVEQAAAFVAAAGAFSDVELLDPCACRGWSRLDLVTHLRLGLEELAASLAVPATGLVDRDAATYWTAHPDDRDDDPVAHLMWLRRTASAYGRPSAAVRHLGVAAERAVAGVEALDDRPVPFQGWTLTAGDLVATWVVEVAIHHLDLSADADPPGVRLARSTLEALTGAVLPATLPDRDAVRIGLGRTPWPPDLPPVPGYPVTL